MIRFDSSSFLEKREVKAPQLPRLTSKESYIMPSFTQELSELELQLQCIFDSFGHWSGEEGSLTNILMIVKKKMKRLADIVGKRILELDRAQRSNPIIHRLEEICRDSLTGYQGKFDCEILQDMRSQLEHIQNTQDIFNDGDCRKKIVRIVRETKEKLVIFVGNSLHELHLFQPKLNALKRMIKTIPKSLFTSNRKTELLPIQSAAMQKRSLKYIPVLAKVGQVHNVGGKNKRGGLLTNYPDSWDLEPGMVGITNTLKFLAFHADPDAINNYSHYLPFMHGAIRRSAITMRIVIESTYEYYPDQAGFLFQKDFKGTTAFETGLTTHGENITMSAIRDIISPMKFPILHHALIATPKFVSIFVGWFPWAYHVRDHNGRSLIQAILAAGGKCVKENSIIFASISHEQIQERDPVTTLFPFAAVSSGKHGDLQKSFYLLRRQPGVLNGMIPKNNVSKKRGKKRKKRKA